MRLSDFIEANCEPILAEWVAFAATCGPAARSMDAADLRDHALEMLNDIVADLRTPQTDAEQLEKSKGNSEPSASAPDTAAEVHGAGRAESGFSQEEMVSEYRALRASVIRLWTKASGTLAGADIDDLMRFNEAIDQALAQSVTRYTQDLDQSKEMFIAILGHDLRTPLSAITTSSQYMLESGELVEPHLALTNSIARSARRMSQMVADLLEFTRSRLGAGIPINRKPTDLSEVVRHAIEEMADAEPDSVIAFETSGDVTGSWDSARISQVLSNLLGNAVQYGTSSTTITATVRGESNHVVLLVHNHGPAIPKAELAGIFDALKHQKSDKSAIEESRNLGIGLYIVERIVTAHGGTIEVSSSNEAGTLFTIRLPRSLPRC